jgi:hypothetical protein
VCKAGNERLFKRHTKQVAAIAIAIAAEKNAHEKLLAIANIYTHTCHDSTYMLLRRWSLVAGVAISM